MVPTTMIPHPTLPVNGQSGDFLSICCAFCRRTMLLAPLDSCDVAGAIVRYSRGCLCQLDNDTLSDLIFGYDWAREAFETFRADSATALTFGDWHQLEFEAAVIYLFREAQEDAAERSPRLSVLASGRLPCSEREPQPGDILKFPGNALRREHYLVLGYAGEFQNAVEGRTLDEYGDPFRFDHDNVRDTAVYVMRADGGTVEATRHGTKRERPLLNMQSPPGWNKFDAYVFGGGTLSYEAWREAIAEVRAA